MRGRLWNITSGAACAFPTMARAASTSTSTSRSRAINVISWGDPRSTTATSGYPDAQVRTHDCAVRAAFQAGHMEFDRLTRTAHVGCPTRFGSCLR